MSYDLFELPQGYTTDLVLVITPYFDPKFAARMAKELAPRRIRFLVDDGSRPEDLEALRKACGSRKADVKIALGGTVGLVHLKGFYIEFVKTDGERHRRRRKFLFGSANATEAAFGGRRNAELIAEVDLTKGKDGALLDYLQTVVAAIDIGEGTVEGGTYGPLRNPPTLYFPSFTVSPLGPPPGFDAWLQRGRLVAKYRETQQFLTAAIRLKTPLPPDMVTTTFAGRRLIEPGERNVVRYPYVGDVEPEDWGDQTAHKWNARLCIWSHLGNWVSDACYRAHWRAMKSKASHLRQARVNELRAKGADQAWRETRKDDFLNALDGVWRDLTIANVDPTVYLDGDKHSISHTQYAERFDKKLDADILLANDDDFYTRYVTGYEFPEVPRFRQDQSAWESFALSWCTSVAVEASKSNTTSLVTVAIREALTAMDLTLSDLSDREILKRLRNHWDNAINIRGLNMTVGEHVTAYWQTGED